MLLTPRPKTHSKLHWRSRGPTATLDSALTPQTALLPDQPQAQLQTRAASQPAQPAPELSERISHKVEMGPRAHPSPARPLTPPSSASWCRLQSQALLPAVPPESQPQTQLQTRAAPEPAQPAPGRRELRSQPRTLLTLPISPCQSQAQRQTQAVNEPAQPAAPPPGLLASRPLGSLASRPPGFQISIYRLPGW